MNESQRRVIKIRNEIIPGEWTKENQGWKLTEELEEFTAEYFGGGDAEALKGEMADLLVCLFGYAEAYGWNLEEIAIAKLESRRNAVWELNEEGNYVRVKDSRTAHAIPHDGDRDVPSS